MTSFEGVGVNMFIAYMAELLKDEQYYKDMVSTARALGGLLDTRFEEDNGIPSDGDLSGVGGCVR